MPAGKAKGFWLKLYPIDPSTGNPVEILFCTVNHRRAVYIESGKEYKPYMESYPKFGIKVFDGSFDGQAEVSLDDIEIKAGNTYVSDLNKYVWDGVDAFLYRGNADETVFANLTKIFTGVVEKAPEINLDKAKFSFSDLSYRLEKDLLTSKYLGTGGIEGPSDLAGVFKPLVYGSPLSVEPVLINSAFLVFQYDGGTQRMSALAGLYENGLSFGAATTTVTWQGSATATYSALTALSLSVGQWADAPSIGCFRLGGEPKSNGVLCCDPVTTSPFYITDVISDLVVKAVGAGNTVSGNLSSFLASCYNQTINDYITDQISIREVIEEYLAEVGGYGYWTQAAKYQLGLIRLTTPTQTISTAKGSVPKVGDISAQAVSAPTKRLRLGADRCFRVHNSSEISDALKVAVAQLNTDLANAQTAINDAADDNKITPQEKTGSFLPALSMLDVQYNQIRTRALALTSPVSVTAMDTARTNLYAYLDSFNPLYFDPDFNTNLYNNIALLGVAFPTNWTQSNTGAVANGPYTTLTDALAGGWAFINRVFSFTAGSTIAAGIVVKKDAIPRTTGSVMLRLILNAANYDVSLDTLTGETSTSGSPTSAGVFSISDQEWFLYVSKTTAGLTTGTVEFYPAAGNQANFSYTTAAQRSVNVRDPVVSVGGINGLGRNYLKGLLRAFANEINITLRNVSTYDGGYANWPNVYGTGRPEDYANIAALGDANRVRLSRWELDGTGWFLGSFDGCPINGIVYYHTPTVPFDQASINFNFTAANQTLLMMNYSSMVGGDKAYNIPVTPGERIFVSAELWPQGMPAAGRCYIWTTFWTEAGVNTGAGVAGSILTSNPGNWSRQGAFFTVPAGTSFMNIEPRIDNLGGGTATATGVVGNLRKPMVCGASLNQTAFPDFNPGPSSEAGAQPNRWIEPPTQSLEFYFDHTGAALSEEFPRDLSMKLLDSAGPITSGIVWDIAVVSGGFNTVTSASGRFLLATSNGIGTQNVSSLETAECVVELRAAYQGRYYKTNITLKRVQLPAPPSGGGGGTIGIDTTFTSFSTTSFGDVSGTISATQPAGVTTANIGINIKVTPFSGATGNWTVEMRVMRLISGVWTQILAPVSVNTRYTAAGGGEPADIEPGYFNLSFNDTGLTGGVSYDRRIEMRLVSGSRGHGVAPSTSGVVITA
jgi:hypothetical protein